MSFNLSQAGKKVEITFVEFVEFLTRGQPTMHMLYIEIIFQWLIVSRKF